MFQQKIIGGGFTLIELLVVVAIIGVLASVVLASLNSARAKGTEAAIKSNLKNMISQAELAYDTAGNYSTACTAVVKMLTAITNVGGIATCNSQNNPGYSDVDLRWGASARNSNGTKNWSVNETGVVVWDSVNTGGTQTWDAANTACASAGGRLPSIEQLKTLYDAYGTTPTGFTAYDYWSSTTIPSDNTRAYGFYMEDGTVAVNLKTDHPYARCVH